MRPGSHQVTAQREHGIRPTVVRDPGAPSTCRVPAGHTAADGLLRLQRQAGNRAVSSLVSLQRKKASTPDVDSLLDLINGFQSLAVAAVHHNGRGIAVMAFGPNLTKPHRAALTSLQRVLFLVQRGDAAQVRRARARWPAIASQLRAAVEQAKAAGFPKDKLSIVSMTIETLGTDYIGAGRKGDDVADSATSYVDFIRGVATLVDVVSDATYDFTAGVIPRNYDKLSAAQRTALARVQFSAALNPTHAKLLDRLRTALVFARTPGSAKQGLSHWNGVSTDVFDAIEQAGSFVSTDLATLRQGLRDIGEKLVKGSVYLEAHNAALAKIDLKNPAEAFEVERVKTLAQELMVAKDIADKAMNLTGAAAIDTALKAAGISSEVGGAIWDLAKNPGEIVAKLDDYKKRGVLGKLVTIADLGDKMLSVRNAVYQVSLSAVKEFAERQGKAAVAAGLTEAVKRWESVGKWAERHLGVLEKVGKVATVISVGVSAVKMIDAIIDGNWSAALQEAGSTTLGLAATAAGGAAGAATIGGIGLIIAAEAEAISGAAAMIRYCREQNVREAASDVINICEAAAAIEAKSLIADLQILADPTFTGDREFVQQRMAGHASYWRRHHLELQDLLATKRVNALGGQPRLQVAMGLPALGVLGSSPAPTWEGAAEQIRLVFAGANSLAAFVVKSYPRTKAA